jgi:hypothetical protein
MLWDKDRGIDSIERQQLVLMGMEQVDEKAKRRAQRSLARQLNTTLRGFYEPLELKNNG